ncbi:MAG TPA: acetate kinase, partial [Candidatus Saccharibacteria bacterium]|nr:acetate kinase [Candidatus Saccharibacteria bacterium]
MALFDGSGHLLHMAAIENIGQAATVFKQPGLADQKISVSGHATAMRFLLKWLDQAAGSGHITAVGHRIV